MDDALVLFSGGQDSTTCLAWALTRFRRVETIGFYYGQRHAVEMDCRKVILTRLGQQFPQWRACLGDDRTGEGLRDAPHELGAGKGEARPLPSPPAALQL